MLLTQQNGSSNRQEAVQARLEIKQQFLPRPSSFHFPTRGHLLKVSQSACQKPLGAAGEGLAEGGPQIGKRRDHGKDGAKAARLCAWDAPPRWPPPLPCSPLGLGPSNFPTRLSGRKRRRAGVAASGLPQARGSVICCSVGFSKGMISPPGGVSEAAPDFPARGHPRRTPRCLSCPPHAGRSRQGIRGPESPALCKPVPAEGSRESETAAPRASLPLFRERREQVNLAPSYASSAAAY